MVSVTPDASHDELVCALWRDEQGLCASNAVVSVVDRSGDAVWGCEAHAAQALDALVGARINQVGNWEAARRLLSLRWNHRDKTDRVTALHSLGEPSRVQDKGHYPAFVNMPAEDTYRKVVSVVPLRLAAEVSEDQLRDLSGQDWCRATQQVALDWQQTGASAEWWEVRFVMRNIDRGRPHELAGLIAGTGEQLAMALAAAVEAEAWSAYRKGVRLDESRAQGRASNAGNEMGHRAMAELATYYLMGTGHALANITGRALALDRSLHPSLLDGLGTWMPVGSPEPKDWLSLNSATVRQLCRVAKTKPQLAEVLGPLTTLLQNPAWHDLERQRGSHYHRRRPQSFGVAGVSLASPWVEYSPGSWRLSGGLRNYTDSQNLAHETTALARRVLTLLTTVMPALHERLETLINEMSK